MKIIKLCSRLRHPAHTTVETQVLTQYVPYFSMEMLFFFFKLSNSDNNEVHK